MGCVLGVKDWHRKCGKKRENRDCLLLQIIAQRMWERVSLSTAVSPLSRYDRRTSLEEKGSFSPSSLSCSALLFCHIMLISMERAKDEPEMLDYSTFLLISSFTMGFSFQEIKGTVKRWKFKERKKSTAHKNRRKRQWVREREEGGGGGHRGCSRRRK